MKAYWPNTKKTPSTISRSDFVFAIGYPHDSRDSKHEFSTD